ncbi:MAG: BrnT family toxin [Nitrospirota bacterium]
MEITEFEWDDNNIEHIASHNVLPDEVEDVAFDDEPWIRKGRKGTRYMLSYTVAGRYLFVVYVLKGEGIARVITAMDMDEKTRKLYKRRSK